MGDGVVGPGEDLAISGGFLPEWVRGVCEVGIRARKGELLILFVQGIPVGVHRGLAAFTWM